jgi:hypothetical protein
VAVGRVISPFNQLAEVGVEESTVGFAGLDQPFHRTTVFAETARDRSTMLEIASRCLGSGAKRGTERFDEMVETALEGFDLDALVA